MTFRMAFLSAPFMRQIINDFLIITKGIINECGQSCEICRQYRLMHSEKHTLLYLYPNFRLTFPQFVRLAQSKCVYVDFCL